MATRMQANDTPQGADERATSTATKEKGTGEVVGELWDLLKTYARQETVEPLKGLVRFLALGAAASVLFALGVIFLSLALLRALQTETGAHLAGHLTWIPYLITLAVAGALIALAVGAITKAAKEQKARVAATKDAGGHR